MDHLQKFIAKLSKLLKCVTGERSFTSASFGFLRGRPMMSLKGPQKLQLTRVAAFSNLLASRYEKRISLSIDVHGSSGVE